MNQSAAEKSTAIICEGNLAPGDQRDMAFKGKIAVSGRTKGVIVKTEVQTILGQITEKTKEMLPIPLFRTNLNGLQNWQELLYLVIRFTTTKL